MNNAYASLMGLQPDGADLFNPQAPHPIATLAGGTAPNPTQNMSFNTTNGLAPQSMSYNTPNGAAPLIQANPEVRPEQFGLPANLDVSPEQKSINWASILAGGLGKAAKVVATPISDMYGRSIYGASMTPYRHPV